MNAAHTGSQPQYCEVVINSDRRKVYNWREFSAGTRGVLTRYKLEQTTGHGVDIPSRDQDLYGGGFLLFPNAFHSDNLKIFQTVGSSVEERFNRHVGIYMRPEPIDSIQLRPSQDVEQDNAWDIGSIFQLYAVDESHLVGEQHPGADGRITVTEPLRDTNHLSLLMHMRAQEGVEAWQGERIYQIVNGSDNDDRYVVQRLGGENNEVNKIIDGRFIEQRVGWSPDELAPKGSFGTIAALYPELQSAEFYQSWISQHASSEGVYFPVSQENGRWEYRDRVSELRFYPRFRSGSAVGSRIDAYRVPSNPTTRYLVGEGGDRLVKLDVPPGVVCLRAIFVARTDADQVEDGILIELNEDTSTLNYARRRVSAADGTHETGRADDNEFGVAPGRRAPSNVFGCGILNFLQHAADDREKHVLAIVGTSGGRLALYGGRWRSRHPVKSVTFKPRMGNVFEKGSAFELSFVPETANHIWG
ncbi:hypothetical protein [Phytoactinopolyspora halophila]|uniref:hypothetical protein n=1 Tax=Phytoactinopolyspora halophila TaxID=1981511 RepID=UPI000F5044B6|nr:hypothetical protein [Phytoactinopolyspora halophila]